MSDVTMTDDATRRQVTAATPDRSTWLMANAGSGKTRVLTDRVARLLLQDVEPQRILCLTYTKAAASEMQNRLFKTLGQWAMKPDAALQGALAALGETRLDSGHLARARRLFARAIETPGGLRIQTIHSFCATLLRRFPLEAGVSPRFGELDDRSARLMRQDILEDMADTLAPEAVTRIAREFTGSDLMDLIEQIISRRDAFGTAVEPEPDWSAEERELAEGVVLDAAAWMGDVVAHMAGGKDTDRTNAAKLAALDLSAPDMGVMLSLEAIFLTGETAKVPFGAKIGSLPTKDCRATLDPVLLDRLEALMRRVEAARVERLRLQVARKTAALQNFAAAFLPIYAARKTAGGWLDFDDLITRATALVTDPSVAAWVLYRLDGGIDHVLVDEAQDTSPAQWRVIELLTAEFTAGEGARDAARTVFVVGDQKQSIYSFQGANVAEYEGKHAGFRERFDAAHQPFQSLKLEHSFRSSPAILRFVDAALAGRDAAALGAEVAHIAFYDTVPGRVDLWPLVPPNEKAEDRPFEDPVDLIAPDHHMAQLADRIAERIAAMLDEGVVIHSAQGLRPVHAGDFLVLVQRRGTLFTEVIRACKARGLPIAGADRLKLTAELAVKDLMALLSFLDTPDDNLSLAAVLRSPLCGLSEAELFDIAHGREGSLWEALVARRDRFAAAVGMLGDLRGQVDFLRPYDLLERVLVVHDGRRRLVARLGQEAEDAIDELLNQALAYEAADVPSLTSFLIWLDADAIEVKRQAEGSGQRIRVMTVHGAKGLEAEIVILPDTADGNPQDKAHFYVTEAGGAVWKTPKDSSPPEVEILRGERARREAEERLRLLYVAMTRARVWLIVAGAGKAEKPDSWYVIAAEAMGRLSGAALPEGARRFETGLWPDPVTPAVAAGLATEPLPVWAQDRAEAGAPPVQVLLPSDLGGAKVMAEAQAEDGTLDAMARGDAVHRLLQHLPQRVAADWPDLAAHLIPDPTLRDPALAEAAAVLQDPALAPIFATGLAEVALTGRLGAVPLFGVVDRLIVTETKVLAVDFKTNSLWPETPEAVPEGLLRQLGAYRHMLVALYPGRAVETAILWTRPRRLMPIDAEIVLAAFDRATRDGGPAT